MCKDKSRVAQYHAGGPKANRKFDHAPSSSDDKKMTKKQMMFARELHNAKKVSGAHLNAEGKAPIYFYENGDI